MTYWKQLIDLLHTKPSDFSLDWFQDFVFGKPAPESSIVYAMKSLTQTNYKEYIYKYAPDYSFLRTIPFIKLDDEMKIVVASYTPVERVIWYLEEFQCENVFKSLTSCFRNPETIKNISYGVLMSKIFYLKGLNSYAATELCNEMIKYAQIKLESYEVTLEQPIVVLGDGSGSMEVAIKTSGIIMSVLTALCKCDLRIFRDNDEFIKTPPKTVNDVILFSKACKACGSTSPAASLFPYLLNKQVVKTFIIVTDEEENTNCNGMDFIGIFKKYTKEVYAANLIFVSFLEKGVKGQMYTKFQTQMPDYMEKVKQIIFGRRDPDLSKLDDLIANIVA